MIYFPHNIFTPTGGVDQKLPDKTVYLRNKSLRTHSVYTNRRQFGRDKAKYQTLFLLEFY